jgi:hypothetical protein
MALPAEALPLAVGTGLAIGALAIVLAPMLADDEPKAEKPAPVKAKNLNAEGTAVAALREIEFDRATGKLSDADYESLRVTYTRDALAELRAADVVGAGPRGGVVTDDAIEAAIRRARDTHHDCVVCGPRPEPDAVFCSSCGRYLAGSCGKCGTPVDAVGARFCTGCGEGLVAA